MVNDAPVSTVESPHKGSKCLPSHFTRSSYRGPISPPEMDEQLRQVVEEEGRTVSELLREAFRLYLEEREWRRQERMQMRRSRQTEQEETNRRNR